MWCLHEAIVAAIDRRERHLVYLLQATDDRRSSPRSPVLNMFNPSDCRGIDQGDNRLVQTL